METSTTSTSNELYAVCNATSLEEKLDCLASQKILSHQRYNNHDSVGMFARDFLLLYAAALVFLMQAGFAMLCAGCVRKKNVGNSMLKNLLDACGSSLAFYCLGYALAFGSSSDHTQKTFVGTSNFCLQGVDDYAFWIFQYTFSAASATIVAGTLAERCQMGAYLGYSLFLCGFVYPVVAHAVWSDHGFLSAFAADGNPLFGVGMVDFAGSGVVHVTGGATALWATYILGARRGRFTDPDTLEKLDEPKAFPGHSMALQMLGTFILWFGWFGFNAGPALLTPADQADYYERAGAVASLAGVNTSLSGGTGGIVALLVNFLYVERTTGDPVFDLKYAMNGALAGLAAISAGCGVVEPWAAILTGGFAGILYLLASHLLVKLELDDAVDAIPVHMVGGIWGVIAVGAFASPSKLEWTYGHSDHPGFVYGQGGTLLGAQLVGLLFIFGWCLCIMFPFFYFLNVMGWFRSDPLEEIVGLDRSYHGGIHLIRGTDRDDDDDMPSAEVLEAFEEQRQLRRSRHGIDIPDEPENEAEMQDKPSATATTEVVKDELDEAVMDKTKNTQQKLQDEKPLRAKQDKHSVQDKDDDEESDDDNGA